VANAKFEIFLFNPLFLLFNLVFAVESRVLSSKIALKKLLSLEAPQQHKCDDGHQP